MKPAPAAPPAGRFTDQLVQCATCGRTFVFTVEEQRQLADAGLPVVPPAQCPRCAPRAAMVDDRPRTEERPVAPPPPAPRSEPPPRFEPPPQPPVAVHRREADEYAGQYTILSYGHVKSFDAERGVGTVVDEDTDREYRFYHSALEGVTTLTPGQAVEFEVSRKGRDVEVSYILPV